MLSLRIAQPAHVIDINRIDELARIDASNGVLSVGAMVRQGAAQKSVLIRDRCPLLAEALPLIGHPETRARGTLGGSIAHADPAAELPAVAVALEAEIVLRSTEGSRMVSAEEFFVTWLTTARQPHELVTEIRLPSWTDAGWSFREVTRRHHDFALVGVAAIVRLDGDGLVADARLAYVGAAPVPVRARGGEQLLKGQQPSIDAFVTASERAAEGLEPSSDVLASGAYRRHVAKVLTVRALEEATSRARGCR
jgi:CO/xanthine dehydrogenase FAD-binding subunit